jgi:hypothetical protein
MSSFSEAQGSNGDGGGDSFTAAYGNYYNSGAYAISNTVTASNNTAVNIVVGTIAGLTSAGWSLVAGGGFKNTSSETYLVEYKYAFTALSSNNSGATINYGCRVRQSDDVTYNALIIGNNGLILGSTDTLSIPTSYTCYAIVGAGETIFGALAKIDGGAMSIYTSGAGSVLRIG